MSRITAVACVVVGLGLGVGFGWISVTTLLEYRAFPASPTPVTVAELAALTSVPRGTWVHVVDAHPDCARGFAKPHDTTYVLIGDGKTSSVAIAALHTTLPCAKLSAADFSGV